MPNVPRIAVLSTSLLAALPAQCPPGAPMPADPVQAATVVEKDAAWNRWDLAKASTAGGDRATARQHLDAALEFHPESAALLFDQALACADDADLQQMWALRFALAGVDAQGRIELDPAQRRILAATPALQAALEQARPVAAAAASAVADLARLIERNKPSGQKNAARALLARWASELLLAVGDGSPRALAAVAPAIDKQQAAYAADVDVVLQGLQRVLTQRAGKQPVDADGAAAARAVRAARILVALQDQGRMKDLQGPPARDLGPLADSAAKLLAQRARELEASAKVWTLSELAVMTAAEAEQFTAAHSDRNQPAFALSASGRYRIETCCGHATLLEVARTIEFHHARLAAHFGADPFVDHPGEICIVPEVADMEVEGLPHWWAAGFQTGDRTVVRLAWGNGTDLGHTLTHELTHRFDGVLRSFSSSWYTEGHAQWTAGNYAGIESTELAENHLDFHTGAMACYKGFGGREKFEQLLQSKLEDYRDYYSAGYTLYSYLRTFPPDAPRFRARLDYFEKNGRQGGKDPVGWFTKCFCDGQAGRPLSLDAFVIEWAAFLQGCYDWSDNRRDQVEWGSQYHELPATAPEPMLMDPPTWSWARHRAEPWFGQDHAAAAALLLHEVGDAPATIAAGVWSLTVDGWRADVAAALLEALRAQGPPEAAEAFAVLAVARFPALPAVAAVRLPESSKPVRALLTALAARADALREKAPQAAAAAVAAHDRIARLLEMQPLPAVAAAPAASQSAPRMLTADGFTEPSLTDYDDHRHQGLWYATPEGDLHVGREKPRDGTGTLDRAAHERDAFACSTVWQQPGDYVLRGRVHFTTSYVDGAIVFGHTRRDRDLRLSFEAGDRRYATGREDKANDSGQVAVRLTGLWERDGQLPQTGLWRGVKLPSNHTWFDFAIHVQGPRVVVEIDGEPLLRYAPHDGAPIEGRIGFAMSCGAVRVQTPTVTRRTGPASPVGLDLAVRSHWPAEELSLLPTKGIPLGTDGTIVLWVPTADESDSRAIDRLPYARSLIDEIRRAPHQFPQPLVVAVAHELPAAARQQVADAFKGWGEAPVALIEHAGAEAFDGAAPWILFVDAEGLLRVATAISDGNGVQQVRRWSRMLRHR